MILFFNPETQGLTVSLDTSYYIAELENYIATTFKSTTPPTNKIFVEEYFPQWIREQHNKNPVRFVTFLQNYYDWLFTVVSSGGFGADYELEKLLELRDCPFDSIDELIYLYANEFHGISYTSAQTENFRPFMENIKNKYLAVKGTDASYEYFVKQIYGFTAGVTANYSNNTFILNSTTIGPTNNIQDKNSENTYTVKIDVSSTAATSADKKTIEESFNILGYKTLVT
jgi:hypothetical protein